MTPEVRLLLSWLKAPGAADRIAEMLERGEVGEDEVIKALAVLLIIETDCYLWECSR